MSIVDEILSKPESQWVLARIDKLQGRAKYCAFNAVRFLRSADNILVHEPIAAAFCAMHATEEAVASVICSAKTNGYSGLAKSVNIRDHKQKAVVSLFAESCVAFVQDHQPAIAYHPEKDILAIRVSTSDGFQYNDLSLSVFGFNSNLENKSLDNITQVFVNRFLSRENLMKEIENAADLRNKILYASNTGYPSGFTDPEQALHRAAQLTIGLVWAAVDMVVNSGVQQPIVKQILSAIIDVSTGTSNPAEPLAI
jgi:hypothetical protein